MYEELKNISDNSGLEAVIFLDLIPFSNEAKHIFKKNNINELYNIMIGGGEDYELLFSSKKRIVSSIKNNKNFQKIGYFGKGKGIRIITSKDKELQIKIKSYSHF